MFKKILTTIIGLFAILLVLVYAAAVVLGNREFLGPAVSYVLVGCLGALMLFFLYVMVTNIIDLAKRRKDDENSLDEKRIEKMFAGSSKQHTIAGMAKRGADGKQDQDALEEEFMAIRKQAEFEAKKAAEAAAEKKRQEESASMQKAELEAKIKRIAKAEEEARLRAENSPTEEDRRLASAEVEALHRASIEAQKALKEKERTQRQTKQQQERQEREEAEAAALRKTQAIESVRRQAEAAAAARRRAAATAATHSFATMHAGSAVTGGTGVPQITPPVLQGSTGMYSTAGAVTPTIAAPKPVPVSPPKTNLNIWERMNAPQKAPSYLSNVTPTTPTTATVPLPGSTGQYIHTGSGPLQAPSTGGTAFTALTATQQLGAPTGSASALTNVAQKAAAARAIGQTALGVGLPTPTVGTGLGANADMPPVQTGFLGVGTSVPPPVKPPQQPLPQAVATPAVGNLVTTGSAPPGKEVVGQPKPVVVPPRSVLPTPAPQPVRPTYATGAPVYTQRPPETVAPLNTPRESAPAPEGGTGTSSQNPELPRRRGRPPKPRTEEELNQPKRPRGRPPKPRTEEELNKPKRPRGRPPKPRTEEELNKPKRPRGRPPKDPEVVAQKLQEMEAMAEQIAADETDVSLAKKPKESSSSPNTGVTSVPGEGVAQSGKSNESEGEAITE